MEYIDILLITNTKVSFFFSRKKRMRAELINAVKKKEKNFK